MTPAQFQIFSAFRNDFRSYCDSLNSSFGELLKPLQIEARLKDTPEYPLETPVVYNTALDEITEASEIRMIVIGDNPGKDEQREKNKKYLVGQSGKIAAGFFEKNTEFNTDFRKNVIILNKTPVHTAKTSHLKHLIKNGCPQIRELVKDSQVFMAKKTAELHEKLCRASGEGGIAPELWLVGYAELKNKGLFLEYRDALKNAYGEDCAWNKVFVFQHFSMNRFSIDLKDFMKNHENLGIVEAAHELGSLHKKEIFG
ncbi:hypothetical protein [Treponema sp.]|uniref:hypothetical protein n=1 Tax=Treponema sp. TaxID=166 RepID=UPI00388FDF0E